MLLRKRLDEALEYVDYYQPVNYTQEIPACGVTAYQVRDDSGDRKLGHDQYLRVLTIGIPLEPLD